MKQFRELVIANGGLVNETTIPKLAVLDAEWRNAIAAAEIAERSRDGAAVNRISEKLGEFLLLRGLWSELEWLDKLALAVAQSDADRDAEGAAWHRVGIVYELRNRWSDAVSAYQQSLTIRRQLGDRVGEGKTLNNLGLVYRHQGNWSKAESAWTGSCTGTSTRRRSRGTARKAARARFLRGSRKAPLKEK